MSGLIRLDNYRWEGYHLAISNKQVIDLSPSEILFRIDPEAYREMLLQYVATEEEDSEDELEVPHV